MLLTETISCEEARKILFSTTSHRTNHAQKTYCLNHHYHPSKSEAAYCDWLYARAVLKEIKAFKWQDSVPLHVYHNRRKVLWKTWKIDFLVYELDGSRTWHESKGWNRSDDNFRLKIAAFKLEYPRRRLYVNKAIVDGPTWQRGSVRSAKASIKALLRRSKDNQARRNRWIRDHIVSGSKVCHRHHSTVPTQ